MKGQYFSFDAIIATVIMVLAFSSLVAYWYGAQSVVESRTYSRLADANRIAESLLSPGSPANWVSGNLEDVRQLGIANSFGNDLNLTKINALKLTADVHYKDIGNLLRAGGDYYILIERTNTATDESPIIAQIGHSHVNANVTAVANRGATLDGRPVRMRVFLWK